MSCLDQVRNTKEDRHTKFWPKDKKRGAFSTKFPSFEESNVKELRHIDQYSKVTTNRSLIVVPFENLFDKINWCWEQTGYGG